MTPEHRPPLIYSLLELRAPLEAISLIPAMAMLQNAPRGDGQPVIVFPGFMTGDNSTFVMRRYLRKQGFVVYPWAQGRNAGLRVEFFENLVARVRKLYSYHGQRVALVGWSLGGVYARAVAHEIPELVSQVVTLGSPFALSAKFDPEELGVNGPVMKLYEKLNPNLHTDPFANGEPIWESPPPVPATSIYTQEDGIASWRYCIDHADKHSHDKIENIRVRGSHTGLTHNPFVMYLLAERLAQKEGKWQRFNAKWYHKFLYNPKTMLSEAGQASFS